MTTPNTQGASWEGEFEKQFPYGLYLPDIAVETWEDREDKTPSVLAFIRTLLSEERAEGEKRGREQAVDYIRKEFNDERYNEIWGDVEGDEEGSEAEFWIFFNPILDEARSGIHDVCDKHRVPDCMECFYTTLPTDSTEEITNKD